MTLLAIDPGPERSAYVRFDGDAVPLFSVVDFGMCSNQELITDFEPAESIAIEGVECFGMPVGREVFQTCIWIGRFMERFGAERTTLVYRKDVKMHLCGTCRAKDPMVRQALIDRFGPGREKAIGTKKSPGPCYGISSHCWSALAIAVTFHDVHCKVGGA